MGAGSARRSQADRTVGGAKHDRSRYLRRQSRDGEARSRIPGRVENGATRPDIEWETGTSQRRAPRRRRLRRADRAGRRGDRRSHGTEARWSSIASSRERSGWSTPGSWRKASASRSTTCTRTPPSSERCGSARGRRPGSASTSTGPVACSRPSGPATDQRRGGAWRQRPVGTADGALARRRIVPIAPDLAKRSATMCGSASGPAWRPARAQRSQPSIDAAPDRNQVR